MGLAGKLKTGLKNGFGPVEHEQGATKSNQKEEEGGEKEEYEEGGRGGPAAQEDQQQEHGRRTGVGYA